jgi:tetratricopeptide (TPR) repeat protein
MRLIPALLATALCLAPLIPAFAQQAGGEDTAAVMEAQKALQAGKFDVAVAKTDEVITRFEARREADAGYNCTSGTTDTIGALLGAAVANGKGTAPPGRTKTYAISSDICAAYFMKGFALVDLNRRADALANFETAIAMDPDNDHFLNELGEWYKTGRQWQKSLEIFIKASETTDASLTSSDDKEGAARIATQRRCRSYRGMAFNYVEMAEWEKARAALEKCLAIAPGDAASLNEIKYIEENSRPKA